MWSFVHLQSGLTESESQNQQKIKIDGDTLKSNQQSLFTLLRLLQCCDISKQSVILHLLRETSTGATPNNEIKGDGCNVFTYILEKASKIDCVRNYIVFLLVIKCAVRTGGGRDNVTLPEVSQEPQVGTHTPHGKIQKFR